MRKLSATVAASFVAAVVLVSLATPASGASQSSREAVTGGKIAEIAGAAGDNLLWVSIGAPEGDGPDGAAQPVHAWLLCSSIQVGNHPRLAAACADLTRADGDLSRIPSQEERQCAQYWQPVRIEAVGRWRGVPVNFAETASNRGCAALSHGRVFDLL